jgi:GT2 family glycosyltransferase
VPESAAGAVPPELAERVVATAGRLGFSAATNRGIAAAGEAVFVATVNDDAIVAADWLALLVRALDAAPRAAAAQGVNLRLDAPRTVDGWGLAWNHRWQAEQLGAGEPAPVDDAGQSLGPLDRPGQSLGPLDRPGQSLGPLHRPPQDVFGVSATAALYRRAALEAVRGAHGIFDERLDSFYEDVELAGRLRAAGYAALSVPAARALHAGSHTAARAPVRRVAWIYGNRYLALAALLGGEWRRARARAVRADAVDALRAIVAPRRLAGILAGWARARRELPAWRRDGPPLVPLADLARWRASETEQP